MIIKAMLTWRHHFYQAVTLEFAEVLTKEIMLHFYQGLKKGKQELKNLLAYLIGLNITRDPYKIT